MNNHQPFSIMLYKISLPFLFLFCFWISSCNTQTNQKASDKDNEQHAYTNELINESSPYLLQHAHNPVNWYPWGEKALQKAKDENKLILISVGYSACHWCHVMEHESFEDTMVARIMNENFVTIKVDREERPDVDDVYMSACHLSSGGSCGWPLNSIALPDGRPFWAGTYFPKKDWLEVLDYFLTMRKNTPDKLLESANQITEGVRNSEDVKLNPILNKFEKGSLDEIFSRMVVEIDLKKGGKKTNRNKFPMPSIYQYLLKYHYHTGDEKALQAVEVTLKEMAKGGIYDQIGGGFARYSTDPYWKVPHFEKMLYDNSQLVSLYAQAYQLTKDPVYKQVVEETLGFIAREQTHENGGFYSSLDADSEGVEGKFYVWKKAEIDALFPKEKADIINSYYSVTESGNWEHSNILYRTKEEILLAKQNGVKVEELRKIIQDAKPVLLKERAKRIRPGLDDKILTSWNALMLEGYIDAYRALGDEKYLKAALKNADFLVSEMMQKDFRLNRNFKEGKSVINAFLDDYAITAQAFVALYEVTFDEQWLTRAKGLTDYAIQHFYEEKSGMFFYTSSLDKALIARKKEIADNVISSSNSILARTLFTLGLYMADNDYIEKSEVMLNNMFPTVAMHPQPSFYSNWASLLIDKVHVPHEVAILGKDWQKKRVEIDQYYIPNMILLGGEQEGGMVLLKDKMVDGQTTIYVCQNKVCKFPVTEVENAIPLIEK